MRQLHPLATAYFSNGFSRQAGQLVNLYLYLQGGQDPRALADYCVRELPARLPAGVSVYRTLKATGHTVRGAFRSSLAPDQRDRLTDALISVADRAGLRLRSLPCLAWESKPWFPGLNPNYAALERARVRRTHQRFVFRFAQLLAHDAAFGSVRHPEFIHALQIELPAEAELVATWAIDAWSGKSIHLAQRPLDAAARARLVPVIEQLVELGWLELPPGQGAGGLVVMKGPLARRVGRYDLVSVY